MKGCKQEREGVLDQYGIPDKVIVFEEGDYYTQHWSYQLQPVTYILRETVSSGDCLVNEVRM
ncbi:hypothetical protein GCM10007392_29760 [Saccharospirillum salsuginis]|uniref:Uncharacterized protein n=2 Tax=Saccharospirillum salsuginis TaxID=418750 RepID=A0A918KDP6_9GAMM|nr:hypothetical protein GCM10007392_29760 [Saccharospirillum salsuginis]